MGRSTAGHVAQPICGLYAYCTHGDSKRGKERMSAGQLIDTDRIHSNGDARRSFSCRFMGIFTGLRSTAPSRSLWTADTASHHVSAALFVIDFMQHQSNKACEKSGVKWVHHPNTGRNRMWHLATKQKRTRQHGRRSSKRISANAMEQKSNSVHVSPFTDVGRLHSWSSSMR